MKKPEPYKHVMVTFKRPVKTKWGTPTKELVEVTKRGFWVNSTGYYNSRDEWIVPPDGGYFSVPQYWQNWTWRDGVTIPAPRGFWHRKVYLSEAISWRDLKSEDEGV